ncbi:hypothetical protein BDZ45DRAFT_737651 [Acephala macrosclerotiorum]|nr:hypothetical protein BDZ45DRAFT_737651 [Acephala macrosclerotiorum]
MSRNGSVRAGKAARDRLLTDVLPSAQTFVTNLGITLSTEPLIAGFNGVTSMYPARWNLDEVIGNGQFDVDRRKIIEVVRSAPTGKSCALLIWTSNFKSFQEYGEAFNGVAIYLVLAGVSGWKLSLAWASEENSSRYNIVGLKEIQAYTPGSLDPHRLGVMDMELIRPPLVIFLEQDQAETNVKDREGTKTNKICWYAEDIVHNSPYLRLISVLSNTVADND